MLTICRVSEIENKIGGGLIEEVLQVAEGELLLVEEMVESRAYVYLISQASEIANRIQVRRPRGEVTRRTVGVL